MPYGKHTVLLTESGEAFCCGINNSFQLGIGNDPQLMHFTKVPIPGRLLSVSTANSFTIAVSEGKVSMHLNYENGLFKFFDIH
jgi:alpha-tubulin suppressor-like RCC1 family protein